MLLLMACAAPEAPAELDELAVYLYEAHGDEEAMAAGVASLQLWLEANPELEPDYAISPLSAEGVQALDSADRSVDGLVGLAVVTRSVHDVDSAALAMVGTDLTEVYPDLFVDHQVTWEGDPACFLDHACPRLEGLEDYTTSLPLSIEVQAKPYNEYLWTGGELTAMTQRNWLTEPPEVNNELLAVQEQLYLNLFVDDSAGGFWRLQATWAIFTGADDDIALAATGGSMRDNSEVLDQWLDAQ